MKSGSGKVMGQPVRKYDFKHSIYFQLLRQIKVGALGRLAFWLLLWLLLWPLPALAQTLRPEIRDPFLADPLQDAPRDPLLPPQPEVPRPLSPLEQFQLETNLDALNQSALALWQAEQGDAAFVLWLREVRLRRLLGLPTEIAAIQRVGGYAWDAGRTQDVQLLTARLQQIQRQLEAAESPNVQLLQETALGFEILGAPTEAIAAYRQLAALALASGRVGQHRAYLERVASLEDAWFRFTDAAATYRELYTLEPGSTSVSVETVVYLRREIVNLERAQQFERAIAVQQELAGLYTSLQLLELVPDLQRAIAQNYQTLDQLDAASRYYQAAYTNAITLEQFEVASEVVDQLAAVYRQLDRLEDVRYLYEQRLLVDRKVYDAYGLMDTFDQLGQVYEQLGQIDEAVAAFQEGLILARHLKHQQTYFAEQIQRLAPGTLPDPAAPPTDQAPLPSTLPLEAPSVDASPAAPPPRSAEPWRQ